METDSVLEYSARLRLDEPLLSHTPTVIISVMTVPLSDRGSTSLSESQTGVAPQYESFHLTRLSSPTSPSALQLYQLPALQPFSPSALPALPALPTLPALQPFSPSAQKTPHNPK